MAFLRYSRDKRGYEHVYLVQPVTNRRGKVRSRILYWYRTPPNVKVGRDPFDEEVRRAIERQNPDVEFDWPKLLATPKPAAANADVERWRERRRQIKADRAAAAAEQVEQEPAARAESEADADDDTEFVSSVQLQAEPDAESDSAVALDEAVGEELGDSTPAPEAAAADAQTPTGATGGRRKRRRRRRHGRRTDRAVEGGATDTASVVADGQAPVATREADGTADTDNDAE